MRFKNHSQPGATWLPLVMFTLILKFTFSMKEILISSYPPVTDCSQDDPLNPSLFKGIEVNILRSALANAGLTEGTDYYFNCTTFDDIFDVIPNYNRPVFGAISGITITEDRLKQGLRFSQPTMATGLSLVFKYESKNPFYLRSFTNEYYIALLILPFIAGFFFYIFEGRNTTLIHHIWFSITIYFKVDDAVFLTFASRLSALGAKILMVVVITVYTAFTTNNLTTDNNYGGVTTSSDLFGLKVATLSFYKEYLRLQGAIYQNFPDVWTTEDFLTEIRNSSSSYIAYDTPVVAYIAATQCDLYELLPNFVKFDFGFMMPSQVSDSDERLINEGLAIAFSNKTQTEWITEYLSTNINNTCTYKPVIGSSVVSYEEFKGLWFLWIGALGVATIAYIIVLIKQFINRKRKLYSFGGFRGKADRKIEGRMTALWATNAATSFALINAEKKMLQKFYAQLVQRMPLKSDLLLKIHLMAKRDPDFHLMKEKKPATSILIDLMSSEEARKKSFWARCCYRCRRTKRKSRKNPGAETPSTGTALSLSPLASSDILPMTRNHRDSSRAAPTMVRFRNGRAMKTFLKKATYIQGLIVDSSKLVSKEKVFSVKSLKKRKSVGQKLLEEVASRKASSRNLKLFNREIMKIYKVRHSRIDESMLESAQERLRLGEIKLKERYEQDFGLGRELQFLLKNEKNGRLSPQLSPPHSPLKSPTIDLSLATGDGFERKTESKSNMTQFPIKKSDDKISRILRGMSKQKKVLLYPSSFGPEKNVKSHSFNARSPGTNMKFSFSWKKT